VIPKKSALKKDCSKKEKERVAFYLLLCLDKNLEK